MKREHSTKKTGDVDVNMTHELIESLNRLNPEQREAVDCLDGPLLVIAGPGTGKTQLLSLRAANILAERDAARATSSASPIPRRARRPCANA